MSYLWFWTFWHWSVEGLRAGTLLHGPVHGLASHWDEWFRYEASPAERNAIAAAGRGIREQRAFVAWLLRCWAREAEWEGNRPHGRYVLTQLAGCVPFTEWSEMARYRGRCTAASISAVVLAEGSEGEASDVRQVEAVVLPADADRLAPPIVAEGFTAERPDLEAVRQGLLTMLQGSGLVRLLGLWIACGARPYRRGVGMALLGGWAAVAVGIGYLLLGPDPGPMLKPLFGTLLFVWIALVAVGLVVAVVQVGAAWRKARRWGALLATGQVRLRMSGGLTLIGGSAGLPFALATLVALAHPQRGGGRLSESWIWKRVIGSLREAKGSLAATGIVRPSGRIEPVVLEPKVLACLRHERVTELFTPWQRVPELRHRPRTKSAAQRSPSATAGAAASRGRTLGYAAEPAMLRRRRSRHLADAVIAVGELSDLRRFALNLGAVAVSVIMLAALPDFSNVLVPPPAPSLGSPTSTSPYHLLVSLQTRRPHSFQVVLESGFWANRQSRGGSGHWQAELRLHRLSRPSDLNPEDGVVWVERRRTFLGREFLPGERVGRYTFGHVSDPR